MEEVQTHCRLKNIETEMISAPWHRIVSVCSCADQWANVLVNFVMCCCVQCFDAVCWVAGRASSL